LDVKRLHFIEKKNKMVLDSRFLRIRPPVSIKELIMTLSKYFYRTSLRLLSLTLLFLIVPLTAFGQAEKLGIVKYTPPPGWNKTQKQENVIAFSTVNETTGTFCIITLNGATPGTGNPQRDFTKEWNTLVVQNMKAEGRPQTESDSADGWTAAGGGGPVEFGGTRALAFLTVISGFGQSVSVLGVLSDQSCLAQVQAFIGGIEMDKTVARAVDSPAASSATVDSDGNLVIPQPTRELTIADLVGEWGDNPGRIATTYVDRSSGSYVGTDSLHFTSKWTIDPNGRYVNNFFEVRNGKKLSDTTAGTITIVGRLISIKHKGTAKYVVRGWLELPDMTILKVAGPWYDDQEIPEKMFSDFSEYSRFFLTTKWVRKK
jgi:hypothetical protein